MAENLAAIAAQYQTQVTDFTFSGNPRELVLDANPNRWFVQFFAGTGAAGQQVFPKGIGESVLLGTDGNLPVEYKFRDCPSVTTGEFVGEGMAATRVIIVECIYLRG